MYLYIYIYIDVIYFCRLHVYIYIYICIYLFNTCWVYFQYMFRTCSKPSCMLLIHFVLYCMFPTFFPTCFLQIASHVDPSRECVTPPVPGCSRPPRLPATCLSACLRRPVQHPTGKWATTYSPQGGTTGKLAGQYNLYIGPY